MKWIFTHCKSMTMEAHEESCNEAMNHIGENQINSDCSSMVVFLNMLFLKYYHAHNIHHYKILKGKFLFTFNILGEKIGRA